MPEGLNSAPGFAKHPNYELGRAAASKRVRATMGGAVIADSDRVLVLRETGHGPVYYFPREDVAMDHLTRTDHSSHCGFKGDASYWSISAGGEAGENAVWSYETPFDEFTEFKDYLAFYWDKMDEWQEDEEIVTAPS
jgi:uncharacterized protein (DUF427 family)